MMGCDAPALLSPFTLTLTLSHRGRGDTICYALPPVHRPGIPLRSSVGLLGSASPFDSRKGTVALDGLSGVEGGCLVCGCLGFFGVGAGVDGGFCPCVAAAGDEGDAFG